MVHLPVHSSIERDVAGMRRLRGTGRAASERIIVMTAMIMLVTAWLGLAGARHAHAQQACTPGMTAQQKKDSAIAWWQRATELYRQELYQQSIESYQHAYDCAVLLPASDRVTETAANFVYNIAQAHRQLGQCDAAIQGYRRYLSMTATLAGSKQVQDVRAGVTVALDQLEKSCPAPPPEAEAPSRQAPPLASTHEPPPRTGPESAERTPPAPRLPADELGATPDRPQDVDPGSGATDGSSRVSVAIALGPAFVGMGGLRVPTQPSFALRAGYPMRLSLLDLELGAAATYTPVPWDDPELGVSGTAALWSVLLNAGASRPLLSNRLSARVDLGLGVLTFSRLEMCNPFTIAGAPSRPLPMLNARVELGVAYAITSNLVLSASPLVLSYSVPDEALDHERVTRLLRYEILFGAGYRM
jgi:hypothetical protein